MFYDFILARPAHLPNNGEHQFSLGEGPASELPPMKPPDALMWRVEVAGGDSSFARKGRDSVQDWCESVYSLNNMLLTFLLASTKRT